MPELEERLTDCFAAVFPQLDRREIKSVTMSSLASWDSLAGITLISVIEEEFSISISPDEVADLTSFESTLDCVHKLSTKDVA
jgi:acyl carrier protein